MLGTSYFNIYKRAITEFKDPTLKNLLENDTIMFSQVMYNFLENAISLFTNPIPAQKRVNNRIAPQLYENSFTGDGTAATFVLQNSPSILYKDDCLFKYEIDGEPISGEYNWENNTVTLPVPPFQDSQINITIYYIGNWYIELYSQEEYILSQFIISSWSEYIQNDKLDIIRLLGDTDFKLTAVSTTTTAKSNWNIVNRETATKRMNKYAWDSQIQRIYP